jgi:hypothetical protein
VVHSCAADLPVPLLVDAGFGAISFDFALARPVDAWAEAWEAGVDLWPGVVPTVEAVPPPTDRLLVEDLFRFFDALGVDVREAPGRVVVTPSCGLAGASPAWAREALRLSRAVAAALNG